MLAEVKVHQGNVQLQGINVDYINMFWNTVQYCSKSYVMSMEATRSLAYELPSVHRGKVAGGNFICHSLDLIGLKINVLSLNCANKQEATLWKSDLYHLNIAYVFLYRSSYSISQWEREFVTDHITKPPIFLFNCFNKNIWMNSSRNYLTWIWKSVLTLQLKSV